MAADITIEFAANTSRFKRDLDSIERDARRTAVEVARSFRDAESRGFAVDQRSARAQRLATEREINQKIAADRVDTMRRANETEMRGQERMAERTRIYTERRAAEWDAAERKRAASTARARQITGQALTAAAAALRIGIGLAREYAERWDYARDAMGRTERATGRMKDAIGRDLVNAFASLAPAVDVLEDIRSRIVQTIANAANLDSMHSARVEAAQAQAEKQETAIRQGDTMRREGLRIAARGDGPAAEEARRRLEYEDEAARINGLVAEGRLSGSDASTLLANLRRSQRAAGDDPAARDAATRTDRGALLDIASNNADAREARMRASGGSAAADIYGIRAGAALDIERLDPELSPQRRDEAIRSINELRDARIAAIEAEAAAEAQAADDRRRMTLEQYDIKRRDAEIDEVSAGGDKRRAELMREQLRLEQEIAAIKRDPDLLDADRERLIRDASDRSERAQDRILKDRTGDTTRLLATGLGGDVVTRRQALGVGAGIATAQLAEARKTNQTLERIEEKVGVYA